MKMPTMPKADTALLVKVTAVVAALWFTATLPTILAMMVSATATVVVMKRREARKARAVKDQEAPAAAAAPVAPTGPMRPTLVTD